MFLIGVVVIPECEYEEEEGQVVVGPFEVGEDRERDYEDEEFIEVFEHLIKDSGSCLILNILRI